MQDGAHLTTTQMVAAGIS